MEELNPIRKIGFRYSQMEAESTPSEVAEKETAPSNEISLPMTQANVALVKKINYLSDYIVSKDFDSLDVNQRANLVVELRDSVAIHSENAYKDSIMMMISMRD